MKREEQPTSLLRRAGGRRTLQNQAKRRAQPGMAVPPDRAGPIVLATVGLVLGSFHRVGGTRRKYLGICLQGFQDFGDAALELRVAAVNDGGRIVFDDDVGVDAVAFDNVLAGDGAGGSFRHKHCTAVEQRSTPANAHNSAPSTLADERAKPRLAEHVGKDVAVGCRGFVDQANLGAVKDGVRIGFGLFVQPIVLGAQKFAAQTLDDHLRNVAAPVAAHVHDQSQLADLRVVGLDEFADAVIAHVGYVDVADFAAGGFVDGFTIAIDPFEIDQIGLAGDGPVSDFVGAFERGPGIHGPLHWAVGLVAEKLIGIIFWRQVLAVNRQDVVPLFHIHTNFGERRAIDLFLILAVEDFGDAVTPGRGVQFDARAGKSDLGPLGHINVAAGNVGVGDAEFGDKFAEDVIQIGAMGDEVHQRAVLRQQRVPVVAVHVFDVEEVAVTAADFVVHFDPLFVGHAINHEVGGGNGFGTGLPFRLGIEELEAGFVADDDFAAVRGNIESLNLFCERSFFAVFQRKEDQAGIGVGIASVEGSAVAGVEQIVLGRNDAEEIVGVHGNAGDPIGEAGKVDLDVFLLFLGLFLFLLFFFLRVFLFVFLFLVGVVALLGACFAFLGYGHFVAFGREWVLGVLAQGEGVQGISAVGGVIELNEAELRIKGAGADEIEVVPLGIPGGSADVEEIVGDAVRLAVGGAPDVERAKIVGIVEAVGQMAAFGGPGIIVNAVAGIFGDGDDLFVVQGQDIELVLGVAKGDALAIGRPKGLIEHGVKAVGKFFRLAGAVLVDAVELLFAVGIGNEKYFRAVRGPLRGLVVGIRGVGEIASRAFFDGSGEDVAARDEQGALSLGAEAKAFDVVGGGNVRGAHGEGVGRNGDGDWLRLAGCYVVDIQFAAGFIHDLAFMIGAGPADIPLGAVRKLVGLFGLYIVGIEVERVVLVRGKENLAADPHGIAMRARVIGDFFRGVGFQIEDVELLGPAAGITFPGAEVAEKRRVDDFGAVGGEVAGARLGHREGLGEATVDGNGVKAVVAKIEVLAERAEYDGFSIGCPAVDLIVIAPARSERAARGVKGQLPGNAAGHGDHVDLLVAVVLPGEGDPLAIGRELGEDFDARMRGKASGQAAGGGGEPEIAGVSENNFVAVNIGKAKKFCLGVGTCGEAKSKAQAQQGKQLARGHGYHLRYTAYQASAE